MNNDNMLCHKPSENELHEYELHEYELHEYESWLNYYENLCYEEICASIQSENNFAEQIDNSFVYY